MPCALVVMMFFMAGCGDDDQPEVVDVDRSDSELTIDIACRYYPIDYFNVEKDSIHIRITRNAIGSKDTTEYLDTVYGAIKWPLALEYGWTYHIEAEQIICSDFWTNEVDGRIRHYWEYRGMHLWPTHKGRFNITVDKKMVVDMEIPMVFSIFLYNCDCGKETCVFSREPFTLSENISTWGYDI